MDMKPGLPGEIADHTIPNDFAVEKIHEFSLPWFKNNAKIIIKATTL